MSASRSAAGWSNNPNRSCEDSAPSQCLLRLARAAAVVIHAGTLRGPAEKLPFIGNAYFIMSCVQSGRERIVGRGEPQDSQGRLVEFRMSAAAPYDGFQQLAVGADGH